MKVLIFILLCFVGNYCLVLVQSSSGSGCPRGETCATRASCPYWEQEFEKVKKLPKTDIQWQLYIKAARKSICNRSKKGVCCPQPQIDFGVRSTGKDKEQPDYIPTVDECGGFPNAEQIFGGERTLPGEFPFLALLGYTSQRRSQILVQGKRVMEDFKVWVCAGTIINNWYIVTAGHCVTRAISITNVRTGVWEVSDEKYKLTNNPEKQDFTINNDNIIVHERFRIKRSNIENDIALIRLPTMLKYNELVQPACLPLPGNVTYVGLQNNWKDETIDDTATVVGWGYSCYEEGTRAFCNESSTVGSRFQQKLVVPLVRNTVCTSSKSKPDEKLQICAGGVAGKSACRGDSGGGLFINDKLEDDAHFQIEPWYLFGIVSFGKSNCEAAVPEIYVRVSEYINWIKNKMARF